MGAKSRQTAILHSTRRSQPVWLGYTSHCSFIDQLRLKERGLHSENHVSADGCCRQVSACLRAFLLAVIGPSFMLPRLDKVRVPIPPRILPCLHLAMAPNAHPKTLFHLVPINAVAQDALEHPDNKRFISRSRNGPLGLEVGYHISSTPRGHVITRLGRNADLILQKSTPTEPISAVHVAFEVNPTTKLILLSVRSKRLSSVRFAVYESERNVTPTEQIIGDGVVCYGQDYDLSIATYHFRLSWLTTKTKALEALTLQDYQASEQLLQNMRSRDRPTEGDYSEALSWHVTRLRTGQRPLFNDIVHLRIRIGSGNHGEVYRAVDWASGHTFAIKVVNLAKTPDVDAGRALLHREIKVMMELDHVSGMLIMALIFVVVVTLTVCLGTYHRISRSPTPPNSLSRDFYAASGGLSHLARPERRISGS